MDAVGCAVLDIIQREQLMNSAASVGDFLKEQLLLLKKKHEYIGDVRGKGLMFGIEIVWNKQSKKPAREIAEQIVYRMKAENIILANEGDDRNILMIIPPMCFSQDNAALVANKLDKVITELPVQKAVKDIVLDLPNLKKNISLDTSILQTKAKKLYETFPANEPDDDSGNRYEEEKEEEMEKPQPGPSSDSPPRKPSFVASKGWFAKFQ
ncbi:hypothetical protein SK128_027331 [Halocaridina rubra]|uniref:Uncharacterized protein n=1 Tax=Halocaridina rubra TaxID=373956 RepID=A0AAN8WN45_HALRR